MCWMIQRGLSTLEYTLIFVLIVIGAIALWNKLGASMDAQLARGETTFSNTLQSAREANSAAMSARADVVPPGPASVSPAALAAVNSAPSGTRHELASARAEPQRGNGNDKASARRASERVQQANSSGKATAPPSASARPSDAQPVNGDWRAQKVGTGGKVAAVAAGAVAGAALAAGTNIATAYVASLACGPGAPVCAGAVTAVIAVGLAGYGVHELRNGGWSSLKGSFSRVFSSEDATVGDALSVGSTLGAVAYGIGTTGLSGAGGVARGEAIAQVGARAGAATRAEIASVLSGNTPELAMAGVPNATSSAVPPMVKMSATDESGALGSGAASNTSSSANSGGRPIPVRPDAADSWSAPRTFSNRHGQLTNGTYTLDTEGMAPHATGSLAGGKSQFLHRVKERQLVLDAAAYADKAGLWVGKKAKVPFESPVGVHAGTGELTNVVNVYRNRNGFVHGAPASPTP